MSSVYRKYTHPRLRGAAVPILFPEVGVATLVVSDAYHEHAAPEIQLTQSHSLSVANAYHAHESQNVALVQNHTLSINDSVQILFNEGFEAVGFDETSAGIGGNWVKQGAGSTIEDHATSGVTGAPASWGEKCLTIACSGGDPWTLIRNQMDASYTGDFYCRADIILDAFTDLGVTAAPLFILADSSFYYVISVGIVRNGVGEPVFRATTWGAGGSSSDSTEISVNTPYRLDIFFNASTDSYTVKIDGTVLHSGSDATAYHNISHIYLASAYELPNIGVYYDNVQVATDGWVPTAGLPSVHHLFVSDNVTLGLELSVADVYHLHTATNVALSQVHDLAVNDAHHLHEAQNVTLDVVLAIDSAHHLQTAEGISLTQEHSLDVANSHSEHAASNITLSTAGALTVASSYHEHVAGSPYLTVHLDTNNSSHLHTADNTDLSLIYILSLQDAAHDHVAGSIVLTQEHNLAVNGAYHDVVSGNITLQTYFVYLPAGLENFFIEDLTAKRVIENLTATRIIENLTDWRTMA